MDVARKAVILGRVSGVQARTKLLLLLLLLLL